MYFLKMEETEKEAVYYFGNKYLEMQNNFKTPFLALNDKYKRVFINKMSL